MLLCGQWSCMDFYVHCFSMKTTDALVSKLPETGRVLYQNKIGNEYVCWFHWKAIHYDARSCERKIHVRIVHLYICSVCSIQGNWTLLVKLIVTQGVKKLPVFHKPVLFIYRVCREMKPIFSQVNSIKKFLTPFNLHLLLLFCLCVEFVSVPFHSGFPTKILHNLHACDMSRPSHPPRFDHPTNSVWRMRIMKSLMTTTQITFSIPQYLYSQTRKVSTAIFHFK
jgi:hypothetical protein